MKRFRRPKRLTVMRKGMFLPATLGHPAIGVALIAVLSAGACDRDDDDLTAACAAIEVASQGENLEIVDPAMIETARLDGDCLMISGSFGGGCVPNDLRVAAQKSLLAVYPPIYAVTLYDAADDMCEALEQDSVRVSLAAIVAEDAEFDLLFEGAPEVRIEVRK